MKGLGKIQRRVLDALIQYKGWQLNCGWTYSTDPKTLRVMDSLVKKGFVRCEDAFYTPIKDEQGNAIVSTVTKK